MSDLLTCVKHLAAVRAREVDVLVACERSADSDGVWSADALEASRNHYAEVDRAKKAVFACARGDDALGRAVTRYERACRDHAATVARCPPMGVWWPEVLVRQLRATWDEVVAALAALTPPEASGADSAPRDAPGAR
jgi:hypothetical protein